MSRWIPMPARFWQKVQIGGPEECWPWRGAKGHFGHGAFMLDGTTRKWRPAHQVAFELHHNRPITPGLFGLHRCDNPPCCNPAHLYEGTQADNMRDRSARGRTPRGEQHGRAKLTQAQVLAIRAAYVPRKVTQRALAHQFGVSEQLVRLILNRECWTHC